MDPVVYDLNQSFVIELEQWIIDVQEKIFRIVKLFHIDLLNGDSKNNIIDSVDENDMELILVSCRSIVYHLILLHNSLSDVKSSLILNDPNIETPRFVKETTVSQWRREIYSSVNPALQYVGLLSGKVSKHSESAVTFTQKLEDEMIRLYRFTHESSIFAKLR